MTAPVSKRARKPVVKKPVATPAPQTAEATPVEELAEMTPQQAFAVLAQAAAQFNGNQQAHMVILNATRILNAFVQPTKNRATRRAATTKGRSS